MCEYEIEKHGFFDKDIKNVLATNFTGCGQGSIELGFKKGTEAILLNIDDVEAMAKHFGLTVCR